MEREPSLAPRKDSVLSFFAPGSHMQPIAGARLKCGCPGWGMTSLAPTKGTHKQFHHGKVASINHQVQHGALKKPLSTTRIRGRKNQLVGDATEMVEGRGGSENSPLHRGNENTGKMVRINVFQNFRN